jgi:hypothetical protein
MKKEVSHRDGGFQNRGEGLNWKGGYRERGITYFCFNFMYFYLKVL